MKKEQTSCYVLEQKDLSCFENYAQFEGSALRLFKQTFNLKKNCLTEHNQATKLMLKAQTNNRFFLKLGWKMILQQIARGSFFFIAWPVSLIEK